MTKSCICSCPIIYFPLFNYQSPTTVNTQLHKAATLGDLPSVRFLLESGADVNVADENEATALHMASSKGQSDLMRFLLNWPGTNRTARTANGTTALHLAATNGHEQIVQQLIASNWTELDLRDENGLSPLHYAAAEGKSQIAEQLLQAGANVNSGARDGSTPLHLAAVNNRSDAVEMLLSWKASIDAQGAFNAMHLAVKRGFNGRGTHLLERNASVHVRAKLEPDYGSSITPLHWACALREKDNPQLVRMLLDHGADLEARDEFNQTALILAVLNAQFKDIEVLCRAGADVGVQSEDKLAPLHVAANSGSEELVELLFAFHARVDPRDARQRTPLIIASAGDHLAVVRRLLANNASLTARSQINADSDNWTALHWAATWHDDGALATALLEGGAELEAKATDKSTPLLLAARQGHATMVGVLLDWRANISATAWYSDDSHLVPPKLTALHSAAKFGRNEVVELLLRRGADIEAKNSTELTPLALAVVYGQMEVVRTLLQHNAVYGHTPKTDGRMARCP